MKKTINLQLGDSVMWTSQSGGWEKTKTGKVVAIVPTLAQMKPIVRELNSGEFARQRRCKEAMDFSAYPRDHKSYIVEVESKSGKGKPTLYWPRVSQLNLLQSQ